VNQSLPTFLRGDPGEDEKERIQHLQARLDCPTTASTPRTCAFQQAKCAYDRCDFDNAAGQFEDFLDEYPSSEFDEEARFLFGEAQYRDDDYTASFSAFKDYAEAYPVSNRAPCIQERVYHMGCAYLSGRRRTFLGLFTSRGVGEEMFIWLVQTYPNAARAADAQWQLGRYYVSQQEWAKAAAAFDFLVKQYPTSEWLPAARYFSAYTRYRQVKGCVYDQHIVREAKSRFESYVHDYPDGQWRGQAEHLICVLDNIAAQKIYNVAQWYVDQGHCWSARYYLERLEALYPNTNAAACGRRLYATLPTNPPCPVECAEVMRKFAAEHAPVPISESTPESQPESRP
jgi:outer membrane protein assembly factor BamD (BamD/ComL family)